jgi:hypothetical protein
MRVPNSERKLITFAQDVIEVCAYSQPTRSQEAATNLSYYERGTDAAKESLYNRTGVHIDRTSGYLYAPGEVRYSIAFDATDGDPWLGRAKIASKYLSREYRRSDGDVLFSQGVDTGLVKGCCLLKHNWNEPTSLYPGFSPELVHPEFFGVEREDLQRLEQQQAMVHTMYLSKDQIRQMVDGRPDETEILDKLKNMGGTTDAGMRKNWLHQVVLGGLNPVAQSSASGAVAQVSMSPSARTDLSPDMLADLLRIDELWVIDDDREDYTTIQLVEGEILLEGKLRHRNLTGVKGLHPFSKICADPVPGYFWGRSEVARVMLLQDLLTEAMLDIRRLMKLRVKPPKAFIGFSGLTSQKLRAAMAPGGYLQEQSPGAKVEDMIPQIPEELFKEVEQLSAMFDEVGGFKPIMQGQGESGVRANAHARTLMRTASPKLRERALRIERDAETSADITFQLMQAKEDRVFKSSDGEQFFLKQIPGDAYVQVDSHSSSPAFIDDARELAVTLKKLGAIDEEDLITMMHPPQEDQLLAGVKKRQAAKAALIKAHPELLTNKKTARAR